MKIKLTIEETGQSREFEGEDLVTVMEQIASFACTVIKKGNPEKWEILSQQAVERRIKLN